MNARNTLYSRTPSVTVSDNRGKTVREILYHRHPDTPDTTDERITRQEFNTANHSSTSTDPRLYELRKLDTTINPNQTTLTSLSGRVLRTESVDAGTTFFLNDIAGRPVFIIDANKVTRCWQYENNMLPGRPLSITEQPAEKTKCVTEYFIWADNSPEMQSKNLAGQCIRHYDTSGLRQTNSVALTGNPLSVTQQHLKEEHSADWQNEDESAWKERLNSELFTTLTTADTAGAPLLLTDARGNQQRLTYDIAGQLKSSWLTLKGQTEQVIVKSLTSSAAGQKLREEHGNGVVTTYNYEPETQRLIGVKTERPQIHKLGAKIFQDLRYTYDPVGNVLNITNNAEIIRFWRNQKVIPENTYTYDSLYQLIRASGREMTNIGQQSSQLPAPAIPLPTDNNSYTKYIRTYAYDRGGNLTQIRHSAPATNNNYTTDITVSDRSNRAVLSLLTGIPAQVDNCFDAGGHQLQMLPGQQLAWNARGELLQVSSVVREDTISDDEHYCYDSDGERTCKVGIQQTGNSTMTRRVIYLSELELRTIQNGDTEKESLQIITVGEAGSAQVRGLHWDRGKPDDISNDQLRYSYDSLTGSSGLEVDGEGNLISQEEYYPYGGTSVWAAKSQTEANYKTVRYSGKERDTTGLYYYGFRYYQPWAGRWLSADPAGTVDGLNLYRMVRNNPVAFTDPDGRIPVFGFMLSQASSLIRKGYKYAVGRTTEHLLNHGASFETFLRLNRGLRSLVLGVGLAGALAKVTAYAGGNWVAIASSAAAGFIIGATMGFFANKITEGIAGILSWLTEKRSAAAQVGAFVAVTVITSSLFNTSSSGRAISVGTTLVLGSLMAIAGEHNTGMAISLSVPAGQGTLHTLRAGAETGPEIFGAWVGSIIGGLLRGHRTGSTETGERAAIGSMHGARWGRMFDTVFEGLTAPWRIAGRFFIQKAIHRVAESRVGSFLGSHIARHVTTFLLPSSHGPGEWYGAAVGGTLAAAHHAVGEDVTNAANRISWGGFTRAFRNYFWGSTTQTPVRNTTQSESFA
ncbi:insecticidal toxin complex (Tc) protein C [Xenorhabdus sp. XENO-7]|uniref:Insecticidal toxin complex (Tc) protein C n=1 Tax=Xenorhabdus aichiensis TaxID=3025874 RepID=A0ABT5M2W1_9GAMM|nr:RHS repeat-associated core domain-containing protein [Xenorhabdus aichiensis]MDC9621816.1 insecticidal toxin complex (Tc) protein C [Xenorhabdus aichiensis]